MKKFLALLLAAMLLCCTTAMAEGTTYDSIINTEKYSTTADGYDSDEDGTAYDTQDATMTDTGVNVRYTDGLNTFGKSGQAATELWMQVDATGQIDVTVPLVLVFKTNIDGGDATSPSSYKITNHSTADLVVTELATTNVKPSDSTDPKDQPMKLVKWANTPKEDEYAVRIRPAADVELGDMDQASYDMWTENTGFTALHADTAYNGGLFELKKAPKNDTATGTPTNLNVDMKTGRLSFVTSHSANDDLDETKGIHLMTITYTVAIDQSDAYGDYITTEENMDDETRILHQDLTKEPKVNPDDTTAGGERIGEVTKTRAEENNTAE